MTNRDKSISYPPRLIRHRDAPTYLGMDKNPFNEEVRPYLMEIPLRKQGIAFDRLDLDAWVDHYKACNGRPNPKYGGLKVWDAVEKAQGFVSPGRFGTSRSKSVDKRFVKALAQAISKRQQPTFLRQIWIWIVLVSTHDIHSNKILTLLESFIKARKTNGIKRKTINLISRGDWRSKRIIRPTMTSHLKKSKMLFRKSPTRARFQILFKLRSF